MALRKVATGAGIIIGGSVALNLVSAVALGAFRSVDEAKQKRVSRACGVCAGKGSYSCRVCRGEGRMHWPAAVDPSAADLCLCPTCDGNRIQICLNCIGKGYYI